MKKIISTAFCMLASLAAVGQSTYPIGPNLAAGKPAQASSAEGANLASSFAVDNDYATRWASDRTNPATVDTQWLSVDLGATYIITKVRVNWEGAYGRDFQIQVSPDAVTWTPVKTIMGNTQLVSLISGLSASARYVRVYCTARGTGYGYSIYELEVSNTNTAPTAILTQPAANSTYAGTVNLAADATDPDGAVSKVDFYVDNVLVGSDNTAPYTAAWPTVSTGTHVAKAIATDDNGATTTSFERTFYTANAAANKTIPGRIEAESFDVQSGTTTEVTNDTDGGLDVTQIDAGDYLDYNLTSGANDYYTVQFQVASRITGAQLQIQLPMGLEGVASRAIVTLPNTGGNWQTVTVNNVTLPVGALTLRIKALANGFNINRMTFVRQNIQQITTGANTSPGITLTSPVANSTYSGVMNLSATASDADGTVKQVAFYVDNALVSTFDASSNSTGASYSYGSRWATSVANGPHVAKAVATDNAGATTATAETTFYVNNTIPGKIEAESYSVQSGIQTEPTADTGGGLDVGYIDAGDYLDYSVTSGANDYYTVQFRVASWITGAQLQIQLPMGQEGVASRAIVTLPNTGGSWQTVTVSNVTLPVGPFTLRIKALTNGFNFNWMAFARQNGQQMASRTALATGKADHLAQTVAAYPNPSAGLVHLTEAADGTAATVTDQLGRAVLTTQVRNGAVDISKLRTGIYFLALKAEGKVTTIRLVRE